MSRRIGNITVIEEEPPDRCALCGRDEELRPYGPNFARVCYDCAMTDKEGTEKRMGHVLFGDPIEN